MSDKRFPRHVAIILDGNGRWAQQRGRERTYGHQVGAANVKNIVRAAGHMGIRCLTIYAFSTENWNRPADEVQGLLKLLKERLIKEIPELNKQNVLVRFIGSNLNLDEDYLKEIHDMAAMTKNNTGMVVNVAFNYGGRLEIVEAIKKLTPEEIQALSPENLGAYLWTAGQPDPDLIIRTSGEYRLSNFLLWQSAYSEIYITDTLWPDFGKVEMLKAILDYQQRNRRFGGLSQ